MKLFTVVCTVFFLFSPWLVIQCENEDTLQEKTADELVYYVKLNDDIFPGAWRKMKRAISEAEEQKADVFILELNTYGGMVNIADSISSALLDMTPTSAVFINNNAASAGALISISCDSIYMVKDARMGAVTVVNETGEQMPDKYQSYMRATMRSVAESQNRNSDIAEAMVDDRIEIPGIIEKGKTLTFTASEALENKFCESIIENWKDILPLLEMEQAEISEYKPLSMDKWIDFLLNPTASGFLLLIIFGGIYFELQSPGIGFPLAASAIASVLYFFPSYAQGLAENWEIALFVIGLLLIATEIFVLPGFGVAGIAGLMFAFTGLVLSLVQNHYFDFSFTPPGQLSQSVIIVTIALAVSFLALIFLGGALTRSGAFSKLVLTEEESSDEGYTIRDISMNHLVGKEGKAITDLKITGKIEVEDDIYEGITRGEFIAKDAPIKVLKYEGIALIVKEIKVS